MKIDPSIKEELGKYLKQRIAEKANQVFIVAPYRLSVEELNTIKNKLPQLRSATLVAEEDKSLLGGFVIKFGSKMIDLSIKNELYMLKQRIYEII